MVTFQLRGGTALQWAAANPVLRAREPGVETDTGILKIGDGLTPWNSLPFANHAQISAMIAANGGGVGGDFDALEARVDVLEAVPASASQVEFDALQNQVDALSASVDILELRVTALEESGPPPSVTPQVTLTTTGATFAPRLWLHADEVAGTITWQDVDGVILDTGVTPSIDFGSAATRTVRMHATNPDAIETFSLGFTEGDDGGLYTVSGVAGSGAAYNHAYQAVTAISGLTALTRLKNFCAASRPENGSNRLTGVVDFSNLAELEFIECFQAQLTNVVLTGCTSLIRLCLEQNAINGGILNLNPVRTTLRDLRAAASGNVEFTTLAGSLTNDYHFCVRDQVLVNYPAMSLMPAIREPWLWNTGYTGTAVVWSQGPDEGPNYQLYGNSFSALDFEARGSDAEMGGTLNISDSPLASITGMTAGRRLTVLDFTNCGMTTALVDSILASVVAWNLTGAYTLSLGGTNAGPTDTGEANAVILVGRGWTVTRNASVGSGDTTPPGPVTSLAGDPTDTQVVLTWTNPVAGDLATIIVRRATGASAPSTIGDGTGVAVTGHPTTVTDGGLTAETQYSYGVWAQDGSGNTSSRTTVTITTDATVPTGDTLIWEDTFNRADATGTVAVNNNWYGSSPLNIVSNRLVRTNGSYQIHCRDHTVAIPRSLDVAIEADFPSGQMGSFIGVVARAPIDTGQPYQSGVRAFMQGGSSDFTLGGAESFNSNDVALTTVASPPAGWGTDPINTFRLELRGNNASIICNGVLVRTGVIPAGTQGALADSSFGICGEGNNRTVDAVRVYALA